ncbi:hypothetical protein E2C01_051364 [Portunus trituberculatus]|uniref:Uncharacterized protein n=1 Tax=Portunus trituberculatus TaxID=210409 RepID=A0A5B7GJ02_PORTR|nr:hypothetical protein [Portunus trituberculatus]
MSANEYLKLKEIELRIVEAQTQEHRETVLAGVEQEKIRHEHEKPNAGVLSGGGNVLQQSSLCNNFSDRTKVIPPFNESDVLGFFNAFEKSAFGAGDFGPARGLTNRPSYINNTNQPSCYNLQHTARFNFPKNPVQHPNNAPFAGSQPYKKPQPSKGKPRSPYYCNFCRKSGHTEDRCFVNHGKSGLAKPHAFSFVGLKMRQPVSQMTCVAEPHVTRPVVEVTKHTPAADKPHSESEVALSYTCTPN